MSVKAGQAQDDQGAVKGLLWDRRLLVLGLEVGLFVAHGIDIVVVKGLLGAFHRLPPIPEGC
jgi:hypothetical protein